MAINEGRTLLAGGMITILGQGAKALAQATGLVILSRMLEPSVFGAYAVMTAIIAFGELVRDFGLTPAAIQSKTLTQQQSSWLFWINVGIGTALALLLSVLSPVIAALYKQPSITHALPVLGLAFVLLGAQAQYQVQLARAGRFAPLAGGDAFGQVIGYTLAIVLAFAGFALWALVAQQLATQATVLIVRICSTRWFPSLPRRGVELKGFFRFGLNLSAAQLLTYASSNVDTYMIGYRFGAAELGLYNRAFQLLSLPVAQLLGPLTNVVLPTLSRFSEDPQRFNRTLLRLQTVIGTAAVWAIMNAIIAADWVIVLVLGNQWTQAVPLFRLLSIGGIFQVFSFFTLWVTLAKALTGHLLRYNLFTKTMTVVAIVLASSYSVSAVAMAYALCLAVSWPISVLWMRVPASTNAREQLALGAWIIAAGLSSAALGYFLSTILALNPVLSFGAANIMFVVLWMAHPQLRYEFRSMFSGLH